MNLTAGTYQTPQAGLHIRTDGKRIPVLRLSDDGLSVAKQDAARLRGFVHVYQGRQHLFHGLIVARDDDGDQMHYAFKRQTRADDGPPKDFV